MSISENFVLEIRTAKGLTSKPSISKKPFSNPAVRHEPEPQYGSRSFPLIFNSLNSSIPIWGIIVAGYL